MRGSGARRIAGFAQAISGRSVDVLINNAGIGGAPILRKGRR